MALILVEHCSVMIENYHTNYFIQKIKLEKSLSKNDLFDTVIGAEFRPKENDDEELKDWQIKDAKTMCYIFLDYGNN
jgi:hypothetical protein